MIVDTRCEPNAQTHLAARLRSIVGARHLITAPARMRRHVAGYRSGVGTALAVARPGTLVEQWRVLQACIAADCIVIFQAANTGLTGGSTPDGPYDRSVVIENTMRIKGLHLIGDGAQAICLPGTTLIELEHALRPFGREPHSVIGSSCIGASVMGGICNNSGGALVQRGPAYSEFALYAQVGIDGALRLVNHLGVRLHGDPEALLDRVERGAFTADDVEWPSDRRASDYGYPAHVRAIDAPSPARFNADPARLYEASGCAGKIAVFAIRVDTFQSESRTAVFYIGANETARLTELRRHILAHFASLPISGEYMHREAFDVAARYGKDMFVAIQQLGTDRLPRLYALKDRIDRLARRLPFLPDALADRLMQSIGRWLPDHLPTRIMEFRRRFDHHLILKMGGEGVDEARAFLSSALDGMATDVFECTADEAEKAFLHRFVAAGAAVRYRAVHEDRVEDIVALDVALRRNDREWFEKLPDQLGEQVLHTLYYGHFFCHVFHQDYILKKGTDPDAFKDQMLRILDDRAAEYPAEHNVGHQYLAKPTLVTHYNALDPRNIFNPGIGKTTGMRDWQDTEAI